MRTKGILSILLVSACLLAACGAPAPAAPTVEPSPSAPPSMPTKDSWILVDLPADATQLQRGAEIYRLVCSACHAYSGEGLTDAWRATWAPQDQNCWQSKCHGPNHPPDGFELPHAPAVVGRAALAPFATAADLHAYIQAAMPWQDPNSLTTEEGWAVTAYVIKLNRMNPGPELNAENGAEFRLHPQGADTPTNPPTESGGVSAGQYAGAVAGGLLAILAILLAIRAGRERRTSRHP